MTTCIALRSHFHDVPRLMVVRLTDLFVRGQDVREGEEKLVETTRAGSCCSYFQSAARNKSGPTHISLELIDQSSTKQA